MREKAEKALTEIVEVLCADGQGIVQNFKNIFSKLDFERLKGQKVLLSLIQHQKSKNPVIRALTGTYVHLTIEKLGIGRALSDIKESFFR